MVKVKRSRLGIVGLVCAAAALALVAVACARQTPPDAGSNGAPSAGVGPGISVAEALASRLEGPLLVNGWLWGREGENVRLCTGLTASVPPQCVEPSLIVSGFDMSETKGLQTAQGVSWSQQPVQLLGEMSDRTLVVSGRSKG